MAEWSNATGCNPVVITTFAGSNPALPTITNWNVMDTKVKILLDAGHSRYPISQGKRSPIREDGTRFYEYESNRKICRRVMQKLDALGIEYYVVLNLDKEEFTSLGSRVSVTNSYCRQFGKQNCLLISLHSNACGDGKEWFDNARGWSVWTSKGKTKSDHYGDIFYDEAAKILPHYGMTLRKDMSDGDKDYEADFTMVKSTACPAVLLEQLFYTSRIDLAFLDSEEGIEVLSDIVVNAIVRIENE